MSVGLRVLKGGPDFCDIEVMAPDYGKEYLWLWRADDGEARIDLSLEQLHQLRNFLNEIL